MFSRRRAEWRTPACAAASGAPARLQHRAEVARLLTLASNTRQATCTLPCIPNPRPLQHLALAGAVCGGSGGGGGRLSRAWSQPQPQQRASMQLCQPCLSRGPFLAGRHPGPLTCGLLAARTQVQAQGPLTAACACAAFIQSAHPFESAENTLLRHPLGCQVSDTLQPGPCHWEKGSRVIGSSLEHCCPKLRQHPAQLL